MLNMIKQKITWIISVMLQPEKAIRIAVTDDSAINGRAIRRKASRRFRRGQVTIEYFIIAAVLGVATLVGLSAFEGKLSGAIGDFIDAAAKRFASS